MFQGDTLYKLTYLLTYETTKPEVYTQSASIALRQYS